MKSLIAFLTLITLVFSVHAQSDELKLGYGKFDEGKTQNESNMTELTYVYDNRNLPLELTPIAGALEHGSDAYMVYAGVQKKFTLDRFAIIPSFAPGYYNNGDEKDLGYDLQFKSQIEFTLELINGYSLSYSWSHISNADLGNQNEGADNEMFFITKKF